VLILVVIIIILIDNTSCLFCWLLL